ncbi:MAG: DUF3307 domain-containing protein [Cyanobium sp.]
MLDFSAAFQLFLVLARGHGLGDFGLQGDRMAREKCPGCGQILSWRWWLLAHGGIHGLLVALITGIPLLGLAQWMAQVGIDIAKCRNLWGLRMDQGPHLACRAS